MISSQAIEFFLTKYLIAIERGKKGKEYGKIDITDSIQIDEKQTRLDAVALSVAIR